MASGRLGGTKSKVSGKVGGEVYKVVRNADGSYSQIVTKKGEQTVNITTPKLQVQRMVTAMVESLMHDLSPVAKLSFQSGANKSKSLNAFSSFNLRLVAQDAQANWYGGQKFVYPTAIAKGAFARDLGGPYMISSGTLQWNAFDSLFYDNDPTHKFVIEHAIGLEFYGLRFTVNLDFDTYGMFLDRYKLTLLDSIVMCGFREWYEYNTATDEATEQLANCYFILKPNPQISYDTIITENNLNELFLVESDLQPVTIPGRNRHFIGIGWLADVNNLSESFWYFAGFTISYLEGKKKISTSFYQPTTKSAQLYQDFAWPAYVFGSWMGDYQNHNFPSPFV